MSIEAMKLALEWIEGNGKYEDGDSIATALRQAIEQAQKQEPVAWIEHHKAGDNLVWDEPNKGTPLYTKEQL